MHLTVRFHTLFLHFASLGSNVLHDFTIFPPPIDIALTTIHISLWYPSRPWMHIPAVKTIVEMLCSMICKVSQYLLISFLDLTNIYLVNIDILYGCTNNTHLLSRVASTPNKEKQINCHLSGTRRRVGWERSWWGRVLHRVITSQYASRKGVACLGRRWRDGLEAMDKSSVASHLNVSKGTKTKVVIVEWSTQIGADRERSIDIQRKTGKVHNTKNFGVFKDED